MNDKIKDRIIQLIINDKEISGKQKAEILKELFDSQPCLREHYPSPYPWFQPCPCPPDTYPPITYTTGTAIDCNSGGGTILPVSDEFIFNIHPNN